MVCILSNLDLNPCLLFQEFSRKTDGYVDFTLDWFRLCRLQTTDTQNERRGSKRWDFYISTFFATLNHFWTSAHVSSSFTWTKTVPGYAPSSRKTIVVPGYKLFDYTLLPLTLGTLLTSQLQIWMTKNYTYPISIIRTIYHWYYFINTFYSSSINITFYQ